jgi:DNA-binding GntR family transcriptional regulator
MRIWHVFTDRLTNFSEHVEEHRDLLNHIADGDADLARSLAASHVRTFERAVRVLI